MYVADLRIRKEVVISVHVVRTYVSATWILLSICMAFVCGSIWYAAHLPRYIHCATAAVWEAASSVQEAMKV